MSRRDNSGLVVVIGLGIVAAVLVGIVAFLLLQPDAARELQHPPEEKQAVRAYLQEFTNSGKWEEVRWWPAVTVREGNKARRLVKVRVRTHNKLGALTVGDFIFEITRGQAKPALLDEATAAKFFPGP